jgi:hypothetical protein
MLEDMRKTISMAARALMSRPNWREELEQSRRDAAAGRGRPLEVVLKELGLDRPAQRKRRSAAPRER